MKMFENAKFGDKYLMRNGNVAIFVKHGNVMSYCLCEGNTETSLYFSDGEFSLSGLESEFDIVRRF